RQRDPLAATCSDRHGGGVYFRSNATIPFYAVSHSSVRGAVRVAALAGALLLALPSAPSAHEIPARVTIIAFVKPDGDRLRLLVRVPLEAMRDLQSPLHGAGYLDIAAVDSLLPDAARIDGRDVEVARAVQ